ncbi:MAG TPA: D-cysteine desulfhydrase family protein [Acetobacteraceae bacterium]|nr:D-cysteine desulfhydrase family protein [Acetobacteraceae bacterium]
MSTATAMAPLTRDQLAARIARLPRLPLAHLPTPLDFCPRLTRALGGPQIYIKRDDLTGLAFGGNKTRQLEFLFPGILAEQPDTVVAGAYTQSNWCRQITAAAARCGLRARLVLVHGVKGPLPQGNLLLDRLMGAEVDVVQLDDMHELEPLLEQAADTLRRAGRRPYVIQPFAMQTQAASAIGYVNAALELDEQLAVAGIRADRLFVAAANVTPAGLLLGLKALGRPTRLSGICPIRWADDRATDIAGIANAAADLLGLPITVQPSEVDIDESYIGERYGMVTTEGRAALRLVAETEGIFLDPVYSSKAMAGLIDRIRSGRIGSNETVVFLHTGGNPALFAYADELLG